MAAEVELSKGAKLTAEGSPRNLARVLKMITRKASWATDNDEESHEKMTTPLPGRGPARPPSHGRKRSLLRTLSFTRREIPSVTTLSSSSVETSPEGSQRQQQYRSPLHILSKEADVLKGRRWTPPLSPSVVRLKLDGEENLPTAAEFLSMLRRPGVPPLRSVVELKKLVGAASRAWVRDFRIRGGRAQVNEKLREMEQEVEHFDGINSRPRSYLRRKKQKTLTASASASEIVKVREELMQVLLFLHLRE